MPSIKFESLSQFFRMIYINKIIELYLTGSTLLPLSPLRLRDNQQKASPFAKWNRRSGVDEVLERKPLIAQFGVFNSIKYSIDKKWLISHNLKRPHSSKAEEPDCLFHRNSLPIMIATQSPRGEGGSEGVTEWDHDKESSVPSTTSIPSPIDIE